MIASSARAHANQDPVTEKELRRVYLDGLENMALEHCRFDPVVEYVILGFKTRRRNLCLVKFRN